MMAELSGWLLDVYANSKASPPDGPTPLDGVVLWLLGEDGRRYRLRQPLAITFYAAGPAERLRALWRYLESQPVPPELFRAERRDLFSERPLPVLAARTAQPAAQPRLFQRVSRSFPDLTYFDADLPLALHYAAAHNAFPLAHCRLVTDGADLVREIHVLDSPWDLDPPAPPLRCLSLEPEDNPARKPPQRLLARCERCSYRLPLEPRRAFLVNLRAILQRHDPDLLLTAWGDTWLLPYLLELSQELNIPLPLNRDGDYEVAHQPERTYFSYGQVVYRGRQVHLYGRWHIDRCNAMMWDDYELQGVQEIARVTALPVQTAARVSPGTGISAMQMLTALRMGVLVPWHKQQAEYPKAAADLFAADQGGLVYQPLIGLHRDVGEIDFISMYPGVMVRFNISPETVHGERPDARRLCELEAPFGDGSPGLVPQTLKPLLEKRVALKTRVATLPGWHPRRKFYKACASAHKWLLVTCFGYLGYKNARFGRIEAHEAVTAYGREALLRAKEAAEDLGFTVLHMYVDGLWVQKPGASTVADFQPLLEAIFDSTGLPIALDGIFRWVAFLASRQDEDVPVPNRYFGVFQDGSLKVRGIEARRRDAPSFISTTQIQILELLAEAPYAGCLADSRPEANGPANGPAIGSAIGLLRRRVAELRAGRVPLEALVVRQKLSRELDEYHTPSPAARAAAQLQAVGKSLRAGQRVGFIYTRGEPGVYAWDLPDPPNPASTDVARYIKLLLRAASAVLEPFGLSEKDLYNRVIAGAKDISLEEYSRERLLPCPSEQPHSAGARFIVDETVFAVQRALLP